MDIIAAYREAGTYRRAAEIAGTTHKTSDSYGFYSHQVILKDKSETTVIRLR